MYGVSFFFFNVPCSKVERNFCQKSKIKTKIRQMEGHALFDLSLQLSARREAALVKFKSGKPTQFSTADSIK